MRKLFCLFFLFVTVFFSLPVHADSLVSTQALHFRCSQCSYTCAVGSFAWVDDTADMTCPECGGKLGIYQGATFISGGGSTRGGGAGRDVPGFSGNNSPTISPDGYLRVSFPLIGYNSAFSSKTYFSSSDTFEHDVLNNFYYGDVFSSYGYFSPVYGISSAPSGTYYVYPDTYVGKVLYETSSSSFSLGTDSPLSFTASGSPSLSLKVKSKSVSKEGYVTLPESIDVYFTSYSSSVTKQNSISITNNTFNGNIYVDNSDNLTYIYPDNSTTCIVYDNTTNQYITYDQTSNYYYYITPGGTPSDYPTPTPDPSPSPSPNPDPSFPLGVGDSQSFETNGETSISGSVSAKAGDYILATVSARSDISIPDSMTVLKIGDYITSSSGTKQSMSFAYEQVQEDGTYIYKFTQSSTGRMYLSLIVLSNIDGLKYSGKYYTTGNGSSSLSVPDKSSGDMLVWGCSAITWPSVAPYGLWTTSPDDLTYLTIMDGDIDPLLHGIAGSRMNDRQEELVRSALPQQRQRQLDFLALNEEYQRLLQDVGS